MYEFRLKFQVCSQEPNQQYCHIGSINGLALARRQAII